MKQSINIDNYKIIKKIGGGMEGTVYLVSKGNKKYALKIEHILESNIKQNKYSPLWREIYFMHQIASKYPDQFTQLIEYDIIANCKHKQKYSLDTKIFSIKTQKMINDIAESKYCVRKVYTLIDSTLTHVLTKKTITTQQAYSMVVQLVDILDKMHSRGWVHGDFHTGNIGVLNTKKSHINIANYHIPTFGYIYKAIDYGLVKNKKYLGKNEKKYFDDNMKYEISNIKYQLVNSGVWTYVRKHKLKVPGFKEHRAICIKNPGFDIVTKLTNDKFSQMFLFEILYTEQFQRALLGTHFTAVFPIKLLVPIADIMYFVSVEDSPAKIIEYFANKLNAK